MAYLMSSPSGSSGPLEGLYTHLKGFGHRGSGFIQVFQTVAQDGHARYYMIYQSQNDNASYQNTFILRNQGIPKVSIVDLV